ncbi:hypothetical protein AAHC03_026176 [Spirometra sp. Aus1]
MRPNESENVKLYTDTYSVDIPRSALVSSSMFFQAAFESGMSETRSGRFFLPEFSDRQLQHLANFTSNLHLFASDSSSPPTKSKPSTALESVLVPSVTNECEKEEKLCRIIEATLVADYLQMPCFKKQLVDWLQELLSSACDKYSACFSQTHRCSFFTEALTILSDRRLHDLKRVFVEYLYRFPQFFFSPRYAALDITQSSLSKLVVRWLSSDKLYFKSEDELVDIVSDWIQMSCQSKRRYLSNERRCELLLTLTSPLRLGLLSWYGLQALISLLNENLTLVAEDFSLNCLLLVSQALIARDLCSSIQSALCASLLPADLRNSLGCQAFRQRANVPVLTFIVKQDFPMPAISAYFIDLVQGRSLCSRIPSSVESAFLSEPSESNPIHLCTAELQDCQNLVFLFMHQVNVACVRGCVWNLATLEAEWLPPLSLKHSMFNWAADSHHLSFAAPHSVGVVYSADGLVVYCSFSVLGDAVLCLYQFDPGSWTWKPLSPQKLELNFGWTGGNFFTPMPQATRQGDSWLYGTMELPTGSVFIRARPSRTTSRLIEVERLPSPDFVLRAHRLVGVDVSVDQGEPSSTHMESYIFPFNACSRDSEAMRMCYSQSLGSWQRWNPLDDATTVSPAPTLSSSSQLLRFGLSRRLVGFRGVVCTSSLSLHNSTAVFSGERAADDSTETTDSDSSASSLLDSVSSSSPNTCISPLLSTARPDCLISTKESPGVSAAAESSCHRRLRKRQPVRRGRRARVSILSPGSYLVLAGRLAQAVSDPPEPLVSGVWLIDPSRHLPRAPVFSLPDQLGSLLHRNLDGVRVTVALANWSALAQAASAPPLMRFRRAVTVPKEAKLVTGFTAAAAAAAASSSSLVTSVLPGAGSDSD